MDLNGTSLVVLKNQKNALKETQQQRCPEIMTRILLTIHRPCFEEFMLELAIKSFHMKKISAAEDTIPNFQPKTQFPSL